MPPYSAEVNIALKVIHSTILPNLLILIALILKKAFISAEGVHLDFGVTCYNIDDLYEEKAMDKSIRKILLTKYHYFDETATGNMGDLPQFVLLSQIEN